MKTRFKQWWPRVGLRLLALCRLFVRAGQKAEIDELIAKLKASSARLQKAVDEAKPQ